MATKRLKRPRDPIQLGKLIVDIATGQVEDRTDDQKNVVAAEAGRKGGATRASKLIAVQDLRKLQKNAAAARWKKAKEPA